MDSFCLLLQKIRERPGLFLGEKSLKTLGHFWAGYGFKEAMEIWEKSTGQNFFEHYDEAIRSDLRPEQNGRHFMDGFDQYVHSHYNCIVGAQSGTGLISEKSESEEEAFDKFFELLDEFSKLTDAQKEDIKSDMQKKVRESFEPL